MRILIDMDSILADLLDPWLSTWNKEHSGQGLTVADVHSFDLHKCLSYPHENSLSIYEIITRPGFFEKLQPLPGAIASVEKLMLNNECYIASTADTSHSYMEKIKWLKKYLPAFTKKQIFLTGAKHMIQADVLIDDSPANATAYRNAWPDSQILTIKYPYNAECKAYDLKANNWKYTEAAWETILDYLL